MLSLAAPADRPDLLPRHAYWQVFPSDVQAVKIDPKGHAWFELDSSAPLDQIKRRIEQSMQGPSRWVQGARILLFDSTGRIWITAGPKLLLAYHPKSGWIERSSPQGQSDSIDHDFCGPAIEDNAGRVYIGDRSGCHIFDHGNWSYQPFYDLNLRTSSYFGPSHQFYIPNFAKDERGRVIAWTTWGPDGCTGTLGIWVHEGTQWHQTLTSIGEQPGRIAAVAPLPDGKVLICPEAGKVSVARVDFDESTDLQQLRRDIELLGSQNFRERRDSERRILQLGPHVLADLRKALMRSNSPEQRNRLERVIEMLEQAPQQPKIDDFSLSNARLAGRDAHGNIVLWSDTSGPDGRPGRTAAWLITPDARVLPAPEPITEWAPHSLLTDAQGRLFIARYQKGLAVINDGKLKQLSDETDIPFDEILGEDAEGRVYVRNRWHIAAINLDVPDTRPTLAVTVFELSSSRAAACQDSSGNMVAKLAGADHSFLSVWKNDRFVDLPLPPGSAWISDVAYLQPLHNSGLIAQEQPGGDVFFFDGTNWSAHHSFRALIESRYRLLTDLIDNRHTGIDSYAGLRIDSNKNIWCIQWDHVETYDGKQWQTFALPGVSGSASRPILYCLPLGTDAKAVLFDGADSFLAQLTAVGIQSQSLSTTRNLPAGFMPNGLQIDHDGCVWLPWSASSSQRVSSTGATEISDTGFPRLENSQGRIWFVDLSQRRIVVLDKNDHRQTLGEDSISQDSTVVEESPVSFWLNTRSGLHHLLFGADGKLTAASEHVEKGIPKGACNAMWITADHKLWFSGSGRLYRIELPKAGQ